MMKGALLCTFAAEQPQDLLHVVDVVGADGEFSVGDFVELGGGDDHGEWIWLIERRRLSGVRNRFRTQAQSVIRYVPFDWPAASR